jgi:hypothetical protein
MGERIAAATAEVVPLKSGGRVKRPFGDGAATNTRGEEGRVALGNRDFDAGDRTGIARVECRTDRAGAPALFEHRVLDERYKSDNWL